MPSNKILEQKQKLVSELAEQIKNSVSGVVVNYQGITVDDDTKMRKALREAGVSYKVVKNSLTGRACDEVGYSDMKQYLTGMTAIAISENDAVAPAKILKEYAEKIESFSILAGYVDGAVPILCRDYSAAASWAGASAAASAGASSAPPSAFLSATALMA